MSNACEGRSQIAAAVRVHSSAGDRKGTRKDARIVPPPHQIPLPAIASLSERVDPCIRVTGMMSSVRTRIPAPNPAATAVEETCEVARDRSRTYSSFAFANFCVAPRSVSPLLPSAFFAVRNSSYASSISSQRARTSFWPRPSSGRYELRQTIEAPKETLAPTARSTEMGQKEDSEGRRRKEMVKREPAAAKVVRRRWRVWAAKE